MNEIVSSLGIDPKTCYDAENISWSLQKGSAEVTLLLFSLEGKDYIEVSAPVIEAPEENELEFYRQLLEINSGIIGIKFALENGLVWLLAQRELDGLDESEALTMLERVGNFADEIEDKLKNEFGE
jgi:hypothetical protein